jgi:hypothetical protein
VGDAKKRFFVRRAWDLAARPRGVKAAERGKHATGLGLEALPKNERAGRRTVRGIQ